MARNDSIDNTTRLVVLETQVEGITKDVNKLETAVAENYATLHHRMSEMRDDFHKNIEEKHEKVIDKLDVQAKASTAQHQVIADKMQSLEKWRWMLVGAAAVIGYVLAHLKLEKLF